MAKKEWPARCSPLLPVAPRCSPLLPAAWCSGADNLRGIHRAGWAFFSILKNNWLGSASQPRAIAPSPMWPRRQAAGWSTGLAVRSKQALFAVRWSRPVASPTAPPQRHCTGRDHQFRPWSRPRPRPATGRAHCLRTRVGEGLTAAASSWRRRRNADDGGRKPNATAWLVGAAAL